MKYTTYKSIHNWLGLILLAPVILTALTGVLWMHEKSLGLKPRGPVVSPHLKDGAETSRDAQMTYLTVVSALSAEHLEAISRSMEEAKRLWGSEDVRIEKFELKDDPQFGMIVKVVSRDVPASVPYEFSWSVSAQQIVARKGGPRLANGQGGTDWAKTIHDLHTGAFFHRDLGFIWSDAGAVAIVLLGLTGVVLYAMPILKKRANQKRRSNLSTRPIGSAQESRSSTSIGLETSQ